MVDDGEGGGGEGGGIGESDFNDGEGGGGEGGGIGDVVPQTTGTHDFAVKASPVRIVFEM